MDQVKNLSLKLVLKEMDIDSLTLKIYILERNMFKKQGAGNGVQVCSYLISLESCLFILFTLLSTVCPTSMPYEYLAIKERRKI